MNPVQSIFRTLESDHRRILSVCTHERTEIGMSKIPNVEFYAIWKEGHKKWNETYGACPSNYHLLYNRKDQIPLWLDFDFVLAQSVFGQMQYLKPLSDKMQIPLIRVEHTARMPWWSENQLKQLASMRGDANVFISNYSVDAWGLSHDDPSVFVIEHTVDSDLFCPNGEKENKILTVANDFINRDSVLGFKLFQRVTQGLPTRIVGATPGLSEAAKSVPDLVSEYQSALIYLNTAHLSPIPTSMLEAMSCSCCPVSVPTCAIPDYVNSENGFLVDNEKDMRDCLVYLLENPDVALKKGKRARETILEKCNIGRFIKRWQEVFEYVRLK